MIGSAIYPAASGLTIVTNHTFVAGLPFYVEAVSSDIDNEPNWMCNVAN